MTVTRQADTGERGLRRVVLLVEDEPFVRDATCRTLEHAGFDVIPAADAKEAMELYRQRHGRIDVLMTDLGLPGRNGRQLSQDVRGTSAEIPILLTSGYVENEYPHEPRASKTYFLPKPYTRAELVEAMNKILGVTLQRRSATQAS